MSLQREKNQKYLNFLSPFSRDWSFRRSLEAVRELNWRFWALLFLPLIIFQAIFLTYLWAWEYTHDSNQEVNLSGRQRMLATRIQLLSHHIMAIQEPHMWFEPKQEMLDAIMLMEKTHQGLIHGDPDLSLTGKLDEALKNHLYNPPANLDLYVRAFLLEAREFLTLNDYQNYQGKYIVHTKTTQSFHELIENLDQMVILFQKKGDAEHHQIEFFSIIVYALACVLFIIIALLFGVEISRRLKVEESQRHLSAIVEQSPDAVFLTNIEGKIIYTNQAFETITGYKKEEIMGRNPRLFKSGEHDLGFYRRLWGTLTRGEIWRSQHINVDNMGKTLNVETTASALKDKDGKITHYFAIQKDINKQLLLEEEQRWSQRMEALGTMAGGIAHDFNNLLTPIIGLSEYNVGEHPRDSDVGKDFREILNAGYRAKELVNQIVLFSRKNKSEKNLLLLQPIIKEAIKLVKTNIPKGISLTETYEEDLPFVEADPTQIYQAVINLLSNAYKAIPDQGEILVSLQSIRLRGFKCSTGSLLNGDYIRLRVQDDGVGMDRKIMDKIFQPFFTTREVGEGSGLGLATTLGIVQQHDGGIHVESEPGKGSTFDVFLASVQVEEEPKEAIPTRDLPGGTESILFIDHETNVTSFGKKVLESLGYRVTALNDSTEALSIFQSNPDQFDLIMTDYYLPGNKGEFLIESLRKLVGSKPAILFTDEGEDLSDKFNDLNEIRLLHKPFGISEISHSIRELLGQFPAS